MSEVEKMYENARIEPERQDCCKIADKYWAFDTESGFEYLMQKECPYNQECTDECEYAYDKVEYPPFTAKKQLSLIKWVVDKDYTPYRIINRTTNGKYYCVYFKNWLQDSVLLESYEDALAHIIIYIWQDLTDTEKQEIKRILT